MDNSNRLLLSDVRSRRWLRLEDAVQSIIDHAHGDPSSDHNDQSDQSDDEKDGVIGVHCRGSVELILLSRFADGEADLYQLYVLCVATLQFVLTTVVGKLRERDGDF